MIVPSAETLRMLRASLVETDGTSQPISIGAVLKIPKRANRIARIRERCTAAFPLAARLTFHAEARTEISQWFSDVGILNNSQNDHLALLHISF